MSNKLEELKRKLLQQQHNKDKNAVNSTQSKLSSKDSPLKPVPVEALHINNDQHMSKSNSQQNLVKPPQQPIVSPSNPQGDSLEGNPNIGHQEEDDKHQQPQLPLQMVESQGLISNSPIQVVEEEKVHFIGGDKEQNIKIDKNKQEGLNLDLVDKHAIISCSIDQEAPGSLPIVAPIREQENLHNQHQGQSKQQRKHKKIVLKQLLIVKQCVKNLQSALKGLQIIQRKIAADPNVKQRIKYYLNELRSAKFLSE